MIRAWCFFLGFAGLLASLPAQAQNWPTRFVRQHGPLRLVVERVLREFLKCGLLEHGFARLWCSEHRHVVLTIALFNLAHAFARGVDSQATAGSGPSLRYESPRPGARAVI